MANLTVQGGSGAILGGRKVQIPGVTVLNYEDAPPFKMSAEDGEDRVADERVSLIVLHTTTGQMPQTLVPGVGPVGDLAERNARYWATNASQASAHLIVDRDGSVIQIADLLKKITYHAGNRVVNHKSIGIELAIGKDGILYEGAMRALIALLDFLTRQPGIEVPRQYAIGPWPIANIGSEFRGIISHRDVGNRGEGDCGPVPYRFLAEAGYEALNVSQGAHRALWRTRQAQLNQELYRAEPTAPFLALDGDPGPATWALSKRFHHPTGQWVRRPGD